MVADAQKTISAHDISLLGFLALSETMAIEIQTADESLYSDPTPLTGASWDQLGGRDDCYCRP